MVILTLSTDFLLLVINTPLPSFKSLNFAGVVVASFFFPDTVASLVDSVILNDFSSAVVGAGVVSLFFFLGVTFTVIVPDSLPLSCSTLEMVPCSGLDFAASTVPERINNATAADNKDRNFMGHLFGMKEINIGLLKIKPIYRVLVSQSF